MSAGRAASAGTGADEEDADGGAQDDDARERVAQSTRVWVIGQLGIIVKSPACTSAVAETVLQFLSTVAFAAAGPDAHASAVEHVRGLGGCRVPLSEAVRSLAAARTAAIATDALPCARGAAAGDGAEAPPANGAAKHAAKKPKALICLLHKVWRPCGLACVLLWIAWEGRVCETLQVQGRVTCFGRRCGAAVVCISPQATSPPCGHSQGPLWRLPASIS